jgi:hypothetical protein
VIWICTTPRIVESERWIKKTKLGPLWY